MLALQNFSNHGTVYVCARFQSRISLKNETFQKNCREPLDRADYHDCTCLSSDHAWQLCRRPSCHRSASETTLTTLVVLIFVFLTTSIGLVMQSTGIAYHLRENLWSACCLPSLSQLCWSSHSGCPTAASFCSGASYFKSCYVSRRCCYSRESTNQSLEYQRLQWRILQI